MCVCKYLDRYSEDGAAENTLTQIILTYIINYGSYTYKYSLKLRGNQYINYNTSNK